MEFNNAIEKQLQYYKSTGRLYDDIHVRSSDGHSYSLYLISVFIKLLGIKNVLDTGCVTGRGIRYLLDNCPGLVVKGNDISKDLLNVAVEKNGISANSLICSSSYFLPFKNMSFDVVIELGMLHHVEEPDRVVKEMLRVAKKAVFISDSNRFGQGGIFKKFVKLTLYKSGMWKFVKHVQTGGKKYSYSEGDGVAYSYSVFDSYPILLKESKKIIAIPTIDIGNASMCPLLLASHLLVCAIK